MAAPLRRLFPLERMVRLSRNATATPSPDAFTKLDFLTGENTPLIHKPPSSCFQSGVAASELNPAAQELYNRHRRIMFLNGKEPDVAVDAWIAPNASLIGDVVVQDRSTIWYGCVLRGDLNSIRVGPFTNILERTCIHASRTSPTGLSAETNIGKFITIGSNCSIRSAVIEDQVIIGHRCVITEGSIVESHAVLRDGSVVPPGRRIPGGQLWGGCPAQFIRDLTYDEIAEIKKIGEKIEYNSWEHAGEFLPYSTAYMEAEKLKSAVSKLSSE